MKKKASIRNHQFPELKQEAEEDRRKTSKVITYNNKKDSNSHFSNSIARASNACP